ncbi:MAG: sigma-54-dependent Fis family transcriptional regulator [Ignavibacteriae bacterium]|nr:sigma-54-dependent Fis family transcriptional regulator [Ignavibacteriota bacterium]
MSSIRLLYLTHNRESCHSALERLHSHQFDFHEVTEVIDAQSELLKRSYHLLITRSDTVNDRDPELLNFVQKNNISISIIFTVKNASVDDVVNVMKAGALDFIVEHSPGKRLAECLLRHIKQYEKLTSQIEERDALLVGQSAAISEIRSAVDLIAKSQSTALITGESGTGKEVIARRIHNQSPRSTKPFVIINCAAIPKDVIENELFGHEKGAFTGALTKKSGCFELAHNGTLFFDEIAEMSLDTQAKLLRAIETQKFRRLGGKEEVHVDVRMIAATNKNITTALQSREIREDLYYRLSVIEIYIPPIRERKDDILPLIDHFLSMISKRYGKTQQRFSHEALETLCSYDWPGNVREIRNIVERAVVICPYEIIGPQYLPERFHYPVSTLSHIQIPIGCSTQEAERMLILQTLACAGNNKAKAAKILGMSRKTLHNKLAFFSQIKPTDKYPDL